MPTLTSRNNKAKRDKQKRGDKGASGLKSKSKKREEQVAAIVEEASEELAEEVYVPDTSETEERVVPRQEVERATPFSDGIVAASLADLVMVPHASGSEVELTRGFLRYFAATGTYIGSMSSKLSFMKKKGGTLL